jgi:hypothetical protein
MAELPPIQLANIDELYLDPKNPRLGRHEIEQGLGQEAVLALMQDWSLDELAVSFLENGFWPQEALIVVREPLPDSVTPVPIVVEGNRRLAALRMLQRARAGLEKSPKWQEYVNGATAEQLDQLTQAPYIEMPSRRSVQGYLGFRHVTGIKEWSPAEKAQFIAHLIENEGLDYEQVRRRIGSKAPTVRQHYIAYRLLLQMEEDTDTIDVSRVEERFSVLYRAVRTPGVQKYLLLNPNAAPREAARPVPSERLEQLINLTGWLFGASKRPPVLTDSRDLDDFGNVLASERGILYLERAPNPTLESAKRAAGISQSAVAESVELASYKLEEALAVIHQFKSEPIPRLQEAVRRLGKDALQLLSIFPEIDAELHAGKY